MSDVRIIKRYQNRKLYDTHQSCYVTLEEIAQIIRDGNEIQVIDNKSKNDITYITQIQLLFDQEKKSTRAGNVDLLKRVIRSNEGTFTGYISSLEHTALGIEPVVAEPVIENTSFGSPVASSETATSNTFQNQTLN
jgi:polyhydroxyalkanoate synthesis repressor PhaR